jgi:hypothetical protein
MLTRQKTILFAALIASLIGFGAQSQEPPGAQEEQVQTQKPNQSSATNPQGATQAPVIVNVYPPYDAGAKADEERREREEKRKLDQRLVDLTAELATTTRGLEIATIILVVVTAGLVVIGYLQFQIAYFDRLLADQKLRAQLITEPSA